MDYKEGKGRDYKKNFIEEVQKIHNKFLTKKDNKKNRWLYSNQVI